MILNKKTVDDSRLEYYLSSLVKSVGSGNQYFPGNAVVKVDCLSKDIDHLRMINSDNQLFLGSCFNHGHFLSAYCNPIIDIMNKFGINKTVSVAVGDNRSSFDTPTLVKSRARDSKNCVLFKLNPSRHWAPCSIAKENDIRFRDKLPAVCWRGVTTGLWSDDADVEINSSRFHLMKQWSESSDSILNIGLTQFAPSVTHKLGNKTREMINNFLREKLTIGEQLRYRYILSLEGNDVATNLKWIMCSNSIPVMPMPSVECWAMEFTLEPWINFIPIKHDTSDLLEAVSFAEENIKLTRKIRKNNKLMMKKYFKQSSEDILMAEILSRID